MLCWLCHDFFVKLQCTEASNKGGICSVISTCSYCHHHYNHPMSCRHTITIFVAITDNIITIIPDNVITIIPDNIITIIPDNVITNVITKVTMANKVDICTSVITTCSAPLAIIHIHKTLWKRKLPSITKVGKSSGTLP